jgi:hypothetical protein
VVAARQRTPAVVTPTASQSPHAAALLQVLTSESTTAPLREGAAAGGAAGGCQLLLFFFGEELRCAPGHHHLRVRVKIMGWVITRPD